MAKAKRTAPKERDTETRETEDRETHYRPPSNLPDPTPQDGYVFRWIRTSMFGETDNRNVSMRYREGWEPCLAEDHPAPHQLVGQNVPHEWLCGFVRADYV